MINLILATALMSEPVATEVTLPVEPAPLHGTLLSPADAQAAALILPGSGPTDRDGNSPLGLSASTYRLLAEGLAGEGVATLRIDKRGIGESAAAMTAESDLRFATYVDDAKAWANELAKRTGRPCVWMIGHSEGALVAQAAADDNPAVCGLVLLSGAGRRAGDVLREQLAAAPDPLRAEALNAIAELEAGRTLPEPSPQLAALFRPSVQPYVISWFALDPAALAARYDRPMLIGQGTTDIQTGMADAEALAAARPNARLVRFEGVNHLLKIAPADRAANVATYANPDLPLAPGVVESVAAFVLQK